MCPSLATENKRMFPGGYLTIQLFGIKIIHVLQWASLCQRLVYAENVV